MTDKDRKLPCAVDLADFLQAFRHGLERRAHDDQVKVLIAAGKTSAHREPYSPRP
jgi:hypothetical protein